MHQVRESRKLTTRTSVYLWEFLLEMLEDEECRSLIEWLDKSRREFCVKDPEEVAKLWGVLKQRPSMNKKKFCRAIRYYYNSQLITKIPGKMFCYKFGITPYTHPAFNTSISASQSTSSSISRDSVSESDSCFDEDHTGLSSTEDSCSVTSSSLTSSTSSVSGLKQMTTRNDSKLPI